MFSLLFREEVTQYDEAWVPAPTVHETWLKGPYLRVFVNNITLYGLRDGAQVPDAIAILDAQGCKWVLQPVEDHQRPRFSLWCIQPYAEYHPAPKEVKRRTIIVENTDENGCGVQQQL